MNYFDSNNTHIGAQKICAGRKQRTKRCVIDDGFNSELVETAFFDGILEIPVIYPKTKLVDFDQFKMES